jgi:hypothetical protein
VPLTAPVTRVTTLMSGALLPLARLAARLQVTTWAMALHTQPLPLADTNVVPVGKVSVTTVATAGLGPPLLTVRV